MEYVYKCCMVFLLTLTRSVYGGSKVSTNDDGTSGTISFSTPTLDDHEAHSPWMPDELRCDACTAISYQIFETFSQYNAKRPKLKLAVKESDLLDMTERLCLDSKLWEKYGMKEVQKVHRLSGPGLETADTPGVMAGGGKWPGRLMEMCDTYMSEVGEDEIYEKYKKHHNKLDMFQNFLCRGSGILGECLPKNQKKEEL